MEEKAELTPFQEAILERLDIIIELSLPRETTVNPDGNMRDVIKRHRTHIQCENRHYHQLNLLSCPQRLYF